MATPLSSQALSGELLAAVRFGTIEEVHRLLANPALGPADFGWLPLVYACRLGNLEMMQALLAHGAAVDAVDDNGSTALRIASYRGQVEVVQVLLVPGQTMIIILE